MLVLEQNCNFKAVDNAAQPQKPHWEPVTLGARAGLSTSLTSFQIGKTEIHIGHQNPKNRVVFAKNRKPDAKKGKNRKPQWTTKPKTQSFSLQNPKTDLENGQNRKTENPNAPP